MPVGKFEKGFKVRISRLTGLCPWNVCECIVSFVSRGLPMKLATNIHWT